MLMPEAKAKDNLRDLSIMLPKTYRNKGAALLTAIEDKVNLDERCRVIYNDEMGSHIVDLVRYCVAPKQLKVSRPADAKKFYSLLEDVGVPKSLYVQRYDNKEWLNW